MTLLLHSAIGTSESPDYPRCLSWLRFHSLMLAQACKRCAKAKEGCFYQNATGQLFRPYYGETASHTHYLHSGGRYCNSLPSQAALEDTSRLHQNGAIDQLAITVFLQDYSVESRDPSTSRGYLGSLRSMLLTVSANSNLAEATRLVALSSLGNRLRRPDIIRRAWLSYPNLLRSFQITISQAPTISTVESLTIVVLLGLYEVCTYPGRVELRKLKYA